MIKYSIRIITLVSIGATVSFSQNMEFSKENFPDDKNGLKEAKRTMEQGDAYYMGKMYNSALPFYLKADTFNSQNAMLNYKIGVCYLYSAYKQKATPRLETAYRLDPNAVKDIHYYLGRSYHLNMEWNKAIQEYQTYQTNMLDPDDKEKTEDVDKKITECRNGIELTKKPVEVIIDNAGAEINSPYPDYHPVISADESILIFTSRRDNTTGGGIAPEDQMYYEDIYLSTNENRQWTEAENMGRPVNTENRHDATLALSADGQKLFIYLDDQKSGGGNIYECQQKGDLWGKPEKISDVINTKYHECSASLSADGSAFYFVSNKEEGFGKHDIYRCVWDKKKKFWKPAENLGPVINTPHDEYGVFFHPDGKTLYFSSQGHNSMGGFDIFKSVWDKKKKKWSKPENIGYPINTPDNDIDYVVSASGKHAYYSSFRTDGYGGQDIYKISFGKEEEAKVTVLKGTIFDALTKQPLEADIELVDNKANQVISTFKSNSATGKYLVTLPSGGNYGIAVKKDIYLFHSENFDILDTAAYNEVVKDIGLKSMAVGSKIVLNNIFFDFDKATLRPESTTELERLAKLLSDMPTMKIEIAGHTDSKGEDDYNLKLSQSRAQAVVDYLLKKAINKSRLVAKGYGETKPISTNETDEGRQLNRRTEFEILSK